MKRPAAIKVSRLGKQFGEVCVVADINLTVAEGEVLPIPEPSGPGKSTLLGPTFSACRIMLGSSDIRLIPPAQRDIGLFYSPVRCL